MHVSVDNDKSNPTAMLILAIGYGKGSQVVAG